MSYSDEYLMSLDPRWDLTNANTTSSTSPISTNTTPTQPTNTSWGTTPAPTTNTLPQWEQDLISSDSRWDLSQVYNSPSSNSTVPSTGTSPSSYDPRTGQYTTVPSPILNTLTSPVAPMSVAPPTLSQSSLNRYIDTFNNPETYWDEYSQGRGTQFTEGAARAMAKAGRTGMLPTLNTLAHQDYMTNYLPQVRKDLAPSLQYENTQNQTYVDQYGKELGFSSDRYKTDVTRYGAELDSWIKTLDINTRRDLDVLKMAVDRYNIDTTSKDRMFESLAKMWPELSAEDRAYVMTWLQGESGLEGYGASTLAETTAPSTSTTTPTNAGVVYPEGYSN